MLFLSGNTRRGNLELGGMMEDPGRQRSRPALHTEGPGGHFCGVQGHRHYTPALESLLFISSGLSEIPKVEFESFSFKAFFPPRCKDINNSGKVLL